VGIPVWITVVISRFIGGFITGFLGVAVFATVLVANPAGAPAPQSSLVTYSLLLSIVSAGVIGLVMTGLLPARSGCRVSLGTAVLASFLGQMVPFIGGALLTHALLSSRSGAYSLTLMTTATPLVALGLTVLGIAVTAWMVQSSSSGGGSGRGPRYDLYGRARQTSLDGPPEL
jgi:hypothetical protein